MSQIDDDGYTTEFGSKSWKITKRNMVVARGSMVGTLYTIAKSKDIVAVTSCGDSTLWHQRLRHMNEKGMKLLASKGKLPTLKSIDVSLCEDCIYGKQKRVSFSKARRTSKIEKLKLVQMGTNPCESPWRLNTIMSPSLTMPPGRYGFIF